MPSIASKDWSNGSGQMVVYGENNGKGAHLDVAVHRLQHGLLGPVRPSISWGHGNQLRVSYLPEEEDTGAAVFEIDLSQAGLERDRRAENRRISNGSLPPFALLQSQRHVQEESGGPYHGMPVAWWENVLDYSRTISAVLARSEFSLFDKPNKETKDNVESMVMKGVWDFIEIFFVDKGALTWLPERLVDWLRSYDRIFLRTEGTLHKKLASLLQKVKAVQFPEEDKEYWDGLASALSVGWLDIVVKLLHLHGSYQHDQIDDRQTENGLVEAVAVLVSKMPRLRPSLPEGAPGVAYSFKPEFSKAWERWRSQVALLETSQYWRDCHNRATLNGLKALLQVILGNMETLVASTSHWIELIVGQALHVRPASLMLEGLLNLASRCIQHKSESQNEPLQELLLAVIGEDTEVILAECTHLFNPWMTAHVIELLTAHSSHAQTVLREERGALGGISLEENYRLIYAQVLSTHPLTWQIAPTYLASCPRQGLGMLKILLLKQPVQKDHRLALKALEICRLYELEEVATTITRVVGVYHWKHGRKGAGITWLQKGHDDLRLSAIAEQLLQSVAINHSAQTESLQQLDRLVDLLGSEIHSVGGLQFLHRYRDFKKAMQFVRECRSQDLDTQKLASMGRQGADCLFQLLKRGVTPLRFWKSVLVDAVDLLEWPDKVLITATETFTLLNCIQELELAKIRGDVDAANMDQETLSLDRVRLALASNLGRALLQI